MGALRLIGVSVGFAAMLHGQVCRLSVAGLNQARRVIGPVHAECPDEVVHTAPFGNWGVTSNYGQKGDSHQFDGWCHDTRACSNSGSCQVRCTTGWYEWNSCTDETQFRAPNCTLYNAANCTEQVTATGINVHGTKYVDTPVRCPTLSAGAPAQGGCLDAHTYASGTNFMSLYELDPATPDDLIQTLYFPETVVDLACDVWGCAPAVSTWVAPSSYASPASPARVYAELAAIVNWGAFVDANGACSFLSRTMAFVSAASYVGPILAPGSIGSGFGAALSPVAESAEKLPLPMSLGGVSFLITDSLRRSYNVPLFFVSPEQVNFLVPSGVTPGPAVISVYRGQVLQFSSNAQIEAIAPALFSANSDGKGVAAAVAVHVKPDGSQSWHYVFTPDAPVGSRTSTPIEVGPSDEAVYLLLFGTGIRGRSSLAAVRATVGGISAAVEYAGPQPDFVGLDQVNVRIPRAPATPRGEVDIVLSVDERPANKVTVNIR